MEANTYKLEKIFEPTINFQIPLFQRPYIWQIDNEIEALWIDLQDLLERRLHIGDSRPHFLGAVVLEQLENVTGSIETRQVIDGQQRFTTLQLLLIAARDVASYFQFDRISNKFKELTENSEARVEQRRDRYKVLPTNIDRPAFEVVFDAKGPDEAEDRLEVSIQGYNRGLLAGIKDYLPGAGCIRKYFFVGATTQANVPDIGGVNTGCPEFNSE